MRGLSVLTVALAAGLGAARIVETVKEAIPVVPPQPYKSALASALAAAGGAVLSDGGWRERTCTALASMGVAMFAHEAAALTSVHTDHQKVLVFRASSARS